MRALASPVLLKLVPLLVPIALGAGAAALSLRAAAAQESRVSTLLETPAPAIPFEPPLLADWDDMECASCHAVVAREWAASAHGLAWVDTHYQENLKGKRRPQSCHACHIPKPLLADGALPRRARPRDAAGPDAHFGIVCATCHAGPNGTILGPFGAETDAHESVLSPQHATGAAAGDTGGSSALCSVCHATNIGPVIGIAEDFAEAGMAARGLSCVGCHMAPVERRWAHAAGADPASDESAPVRLGRSHLLQTPRDPAFLRLAFGWSLEGEAGALTLVLENQAGHRVPGLIERFLTFRLSSLDANGAELAVESFILDTSAYLPVDGRREFALAPGAVGVEIVGVHEDPRAEKPLEFLRQKLTE